MIKCDLSSKITSLTMDLVISPTLMLCYMYFLQGLPYGLQARFLPIYFRVHGMSLSNISFIKILFFPWLCKFLWAPLVDHYGNKSIWLTWSMVGLCITSIIAACVEPHSLLPLCGILFLFNFLTSTQDIATDGLAIEILTASEIANGNIAQVVGYKIGAIVGGGLLTWLSDYFSWGTIFITLALNYAMAVYVVKNLVPKCRYTYLEMTVPEPQELQQTRDDSHCKKNTLLQSGVTANNVTNTYCTSEHIKSSHKNVNNSSVTYKTTNSSERQLQESCVHRKCSDSYCVPNVAGKENYGQSGGHWIKMHFSEVLSTEGTIWILVFVMLYKLGEQGALNMMPMFLIDHGMIAADVGMWTGVMGQAVSIAGSLIGGMMVSSQRCTSLSLLKSLGIMKVLVLSAEASVIFVADKYGSLGTAKDLCIMLMMLLLVVSGSISTAAFTLMMLCSQRANARCQASHYSLLATAEVLGKLLFSVFVGALTDAVGYPWAFGLFTLLSIIVLPLFSYAPHCLLSCSSQQGVEKTAKIH